MTPSFTAFRAKAPLGEALVRFVSELGAVTRGGGRGERLFPVLDDAGGLVGVVTRTQLVLAALAPELERPPTMSDLGLKQPQVCHPDMTLREAAHLFAERGITRAPVVAEDDPQRVVGMVSLADLLEGRLRDLHEERISERMIDLRELVRLGRPRR